MVPAERVIELRDRTREWAERLRTSIVDREENWIRIGVKGVICDIGIGQTFKPSEPVFMDRFDDFFAQHEAFFIVNDKQAKADEIFAGADEAMSIQSIVEIGRIGGMIRLTLIGLKDAKKAMEYRLGPAGTYVALFDPETIGNR
ncbi:hypothetical protein [Ensifer sp. SL37]|uniref:hypothetical protein n=1 Tax=Ensifer sp. SL37 TaxID=2995137 RepID=UPI002275E9ED|nr:hypothetical protein [Ensifer sp. SL37]MCY1741435.1 hypothetical protein [Ensifer sp. SL37]